MCTIAQRRAPLPGLEIRAVRASLCPPCLTHIRIVISEGGIVFPGQNAVPGEGTVRATWVLAKRDGRWHVAAYHYSAAN